MWVPRHVKSLQADVSTTWTWTLHQEKGKACKLSYWRRESSQCKFYNVHATSCRRTSYNIKKQVSLDAISTIYNFVDLTRVTHPPREWGLQHSVPGRAEQTLSTSPFPCPNPSPRHKPHWTTLRGPVAAFSGYSNTLEKPMPHTYRSICRRLAQFHCHKMEGFLCAFELLAGIRGRRLFWCWISWRNIMHTFSVGSFLLRLDTNPFLNVAQTECEMMGRISSLCHQPHTHDLKLPSSGFERERW